MPGPQAVLETVKTHRLVAVVRTGSRPDAERVVEAVIDGGFRLIEVTTTTPQAGELISWANKRFAPDVVVGAGSVVDPSAAPSLAQAGAKFLVSPIFDPALLRECASAKVLGIPAGFTPTELFNAHRAGASLIKVFPGGALGPGYIKDVLAPMPGLPLMPTGGISIENVGTWLRAGACAVGVGSALAQAAWIDQGRFDRVSDAAARFVTAAAV